MTENTREIVLDALLEAERGGEYSHRLVRAVLDKYHYLGVQEKAFMKRLMEGTIERKITLDYVLEHCTGTPVRKMKPLIRCLLRMSVYQLYYMDSIPDSAACNEAVKLAGRRKFVGLKGFVNGVLRTAARTRGSIPFPDREREPVSFYSVKYSMPEWIVELWLDEYGRDITEKLLEGLLEVHPVTIRFRSALDKKARQEYIAQMEKADVRVTSLPWPDYACRLEGLEGAASLPGFEEGAFLVQDVSSMLAVEAAGIGRDSVVLDMCAAPGGKTLAASERAAKVVAGDISPRKVELLEENAARMRAGNVEIRLWDASEYEPELERQADVLLLDVPCSGLGVMGKKRDIKYRVKPESLESLVELQRRIVETCWRYVKPGGTLLYSTCTVRRQENEDMCRWICGNLPFDPVSLEDFLPAAVLEQRRLLRRLCPETELTQEQQDCCVQLLPGFLETDGFFFARFRRREVE